MGNDPDTSLEEVKNFAIRVAAMIRKACVLTPIKQKYLSAGVDAIQAFPSPHPAECEFGLNTAENSPHGTDTRALVIQIRPQGLDIYFSGFINGVQGADTFVRHGYHAGQKSVFGHVEPTFYPAIEFLEEVLSTLVKSNGVGYVSS